MGWNEIQGGHGASCRESDSKWAPRSPHLCHPLPIPDWSIPPPTPATCTWCSVASPGWRVWSTSSCGHTSARPSRCGAGSPCTDPAALAAGPQEGRKRTITPQLLTEAVFQRFSFLLLALSCHHWKKLPLPNNRWTSQMFDFFVVAIVSWESFFHFVWWKFSLFFSFIKQHNPGTSLEGQRLRLRTPNAGGPCLIPGQGTRSRMLQLREPAGCN